MRALISPAITARPRCCAPMPGAYTVAIGTPQRHEGDEPWIYVVTATTTDQAATRALAAILADQQEPDFDPATVYLGEPSFIVLTVVSGVPLATYGRTWNDRRSTTAIDTSPGKAVCRQIIHGVLDRIAARARLRKERHEIGRWHSSRPARIIAPAPVATGSASAHTDSPTVEGTVAVCAASYYTDLRNGYAFVFRIPDGGDHITVYAATGYRYLVGDRYRLTLTPTGPTTLAAAVSFADDSTGSEDQS
jgi:hypothetical protein